MRNQDPSAETGRDPCTDPAELFRPKLTKYIVPGKHGLTVKQHAFLLCDSVEEILYGGAVGGGKTWALLAAALQYVDVPGYAAILFRRTYPEMSQPGGILWLAHRILAGTDARWDEDIYGYQFPSSATVSFGHLEDEQAFKRYKGGEYHFEGFDEAVDVIKAHMEFLPTRLRRADTSRVPIRIRYASNPSGISHDWLKREFIDNPVPGRRVYLPARLSDNPYLDQADYLKRLERLDPVTREQLINGDWTVRASGNIFRASWFRYYTVLPGGHLIPRGEAEQNIDPWSLFRFATVDLATSKSETADYFVCAIWGYDARTARLYLLDVTREKLEGDDKMDVLDKKRREWRVAVAWIESVQFQLDFVQRARRKGIPVRELQTGGHDKVARALSCTSMFAGGQVWFPVGAPWLAEYEAELCAFYQKGFHDDQVDVTSYAAILCQSPAFIALSAAANAQGGKPKATDEEEETGPERRPVKRGPLDNFAPGNARLGDFYPGRA